MAQSSVDYIFRRLVIQNTNSQSLEWQYSENVFRITSSHKTQHIVIYKATGVRGGENPGRVFWGLSPLLIIGPDLNIFLSKLLAHQNTFRGVGVSYIELGSQGSKLSSSLVLAAGSHF